MKKLTTEVHYMMGKRKIEKQYVNKHNMVAIATVTMETNICKILFGF